jgi:ribonuclease HI
VIKDNSDQVRSKLSAFIEHFVPEPLNKGLSFLVNARGTSGAWGRVRGTTGDIRTTTLALKLFVKNRSCLRYGEFEDGIQYLRNQLSLVDITTSTNGGHNASLPTVEEVAMATTLLLSIEQEKYSSLLRDASRYLSKQQNEDGGWGEGTSKVDSTAAVLLLLSNGNPPKDLNSNIQKGISYLASSANSEECWGISKDSPCSVIYTAKALYTLQTLNSDSAVVSKSLNYLLNYQNDEEGYWGQEDQSDAIYATGITLKTVARISNSSTNRISKAVRFLLDNQNSDGGWGWTSKSNSEVEPTAVVLDALFEAGVTEYVSVSTALEVFQSAFEENVELRRQNQSIQKDIDTQVQNRISNIIDTKDKLEQRVKQLETEVKRLSRQQTEVEKLRGEVHELQVLKLERIDLQEKLEQALLVLTGYSSGSPNQILAALENTIVDHDLNKNHEVQYTLQKMLSDLMYLNVEDKEYFTKDYSGRLAEHTSTLAAQKIVSYVTALPVPLGSDVARAVKQLIDRIERGTLKKRTLGNKGRGVVATLDNFENQIKLVAGYDDISVRRW